MDASADSIEGLSPIRILIVDNHQVVTDGLTQLLNSQRGMSVVASARTVGEAVARTVDLSPDIVLMDFHLTDGTGVDASVGIRQVRPRTKLIFLTREDGDDAHVAAFEAGAGAFIHKSHAADEIVDAIRTVAGGGTLFTPQTVASLVRRRRDIAARPAQLTPREREVLRLMADATTSREIASRLGVSYSTIRAHIRSLDQKLGVHSKLEAVIKARKQGVI